MGLGAIAVAQTPSSPPVLPDLPGLPTLAPAQPPVAAKPTPAPQAAKPADSAAATTPPALSDLPAPAKTPEPANTATAPAAPATPTTTPPADLASAPVKATPPELPITTTPLPEPNTTAAADPDLIVSPGVAPQTTATLAPPSLSLPLPSGEAPATTTLFPTTALPEVNVKAEKPAQKTWETTLAATRTYPETKFHYRRVLLPSTIYREEYNEANQHLPKRVTRQDYENLLFSSATRNDINAMRALLNQGTDINARDANGNTPLQVARAAGADVAAKYLVARGAKG